MFGQDNPLAQKFQIQAQKAAQAKSMSESVASERVANQRIASELGLSKQSVWREFNLEQTQRSERNSQQQSQILTQSRMEAKDSASQAREASVMRSVDQRRSQALANAKASQNTQNAAAKGQSRPQSGASTHSADLAKQIKSANQAQNSTNIRQNMANSAPNALSGSKNMQKSENNVRLVAESVSNGTQHANKEKINMSAFFASQNFDASQGQSRGRQDRENLEDQSLGVSGNARMGALVEEFPQQNYNEISLQQVVLPKIHEVIMNIANRQLSWARVVIPLDGSTRMILNFSAKSGKVKVSLSGASDSLREMIEQGWDVLIQQSAQSGIELEQPTFERNIYVN